MPVNINDKIRKLTPERRRKVVARAGELLAEEMTLRELRQARELTQVSLAKTLGITQDSVSRLEQRADLLLSTLRKSVEAMGGKLSLVAEFPDRAPVLLSGIGSDVPPVKASGRKKQYLHRANGSSDTRRR
jgi:DNA-binding XRE family transcriptional regulator